MINVVYTLGIILYLENLVEKSRVRKLGGLLYAIVILELVMDSRASQLRAVLNSVLVGPLGS